MFAGCNLFTVTPEVDGAATVNIYSYELSLNIKPKCCNPDSFVAS